LTKLRSLKPTSSSKTRLYLHGYVSRLQSEGVVAFLRQESAAFKPDEIKAPIVRRREQFIEELKDLDRLVPHSKKGTLITRW
jgi:hypothetical protein